MFLVSNVEAIFAGGTYQNRYDIYKTDLFWLEGISSPILKPFKKRQSRVFRYGSCPEGYRKDNGSESS